MDVSTSIGHLKITNTFKKTFNVGTAYSLLLDDVACTQQNNYKGWKYKAVKNLLSLHFSCECGLVSKSAANFRQQFCMLVTVPMD